jgi:bifunctional aspartokinase / homoserine dehydrogenase 1
MKTLTMKFGGTSVGSPEALTNVVKIVRETVESGDRLVVVVSAMSGVTDMLLNSVRMAAVGDKWEYTQLSRKMRDKHEEAINRLMPANQSREQIILEINKLLDQHLELCDAIHILGEVTPRVMDAVVSFGERLSSRMIAAVLREQGIDAKQYDASDMLTTDETYQNAQPIWEETEQNIRRVLLPALDQGTVPVITGFIGATQTGVFTTLGRGGSDFSAAIFAANVDSDEFTVWTDVDGVMTTDPRIDRRARVIPYISYQEVGELAFYGAKVLHPKTVQPILSKRIPIRVRNTFNPDFEGTLIGEKAHASETVIKAVTSVRNTSMMIVSGKGMIGVPGIAGRTFLASAQAGANILMISQSSSEQSFCFTVMDDRADAVRLAVEMELQAEIARQNVDGVRILDDVVIVTVVGAGMRGTPGVAGRVFTVLGDAGVNVLAIAQGASEYSISFSVADHDLEKAVVALHELALETVDAL